MAPIKKRPTKHEPSSRVQTHTIAKKSRADSRSMKQILKECTIALSGDLGESWEHDNVGRWIKAHGGVYARDVTAETTHLITSMEDYKKRSSHVKKATELGSRCWIVTRDWLEDSLILNMKRKSRRAEKGYTLNRVLQRVKRGLDTKKKYAASFENGIKAAKELCDNKFFHVHVDGTGFEYKVVCTRLLPHGSSKFQKYTIYLFESNAVPHTYMCGAKLSIRSKATVLWRDECKAKSFRDALADFTRFFREKTGIAWDERCDNVAQNPQKFRYEVPMLGRPVGLLPEEKAKAVRRRLEEERRLIEVELFGDEEEIEGLCYDSDSECGEEMGPGGYEKQSDVVMGGGKKTGKMGEMAMMSSSASGSSDRETWRAEVLGEASFGGVLG